MKVQKRIKLSPLHESRDSAKYMTCEEAKRLVKKPSVLFGIHKFKKATPKVQKMLNEVERIGY